eukprot:g1201.t1
MQVYRRCRGIGSVRNISVHLSRAFTASVQVNGRPYNVPQRGRPAVGICLDGSAQAYFDAASAAGRTPNIDKCRTKGLVRAAMPTFTNPNNISIVTGVPPSLTGICGNYFFDRESGKETMMNDVSFLRCGTIFEQMEKEGAQVVVVTAKNKLLKLLTAGLTGTSSVGFSAENFDADEATASVRRANVGVETVEELVGRSAPGIYDPDISIYCMEAGLRLIERLQRQSSKPIIAYLSTTDFVQHKYAPTDAEALDFYQKVDNVFGELERVGCDIVLTADHGMENKYSAIDGKPNVAYLESILSEAGISNRVILPITDPYVAHHGALGGYATVYIGSDDISRAMSVLEGAVTDRIGYSVYRSEEACGAFDLPADRIGDIVIVGDKNTVLGKSPEFHDIEQVPRLRSHGALSEQVVPILSNVEFSQEATDALGPVMNLASPEDLRTTFENRGVSLEIEAEQSPTSNRHLLTAVDILLEFSVRTGHPLFLNQLYSRADPVGIAADWVSVATNTNVHTYEVAPVYTLIERETLKKVGRVVGGAYAKPNGFDGLFVPGGSISNLYGLHIAKHRADPDLATRGAVGGPRLVAFTSDQSHYSYLKAARLTGLGSDNLISVKSDDESGAMIPEALEVAVRKAINEGGTPFFVGSTAGSTVLGAYDPLDAIGDVCKRHGLWHHVDACWGGGAMLSSNYRSWVRGIEGADSLAWNPHKMSGAPLQCSIFLTRYPGILEKTNGTKAAYLFQPDKLHTELDSGDKTIQCGRKTDMLKLWLLWKSRGDVGMRASVDRCYRLAEFAADQMRRDRTGAWELAYEPSCANVCFWYVPKALRPFKWNSDHHEMRSKQAAELHSVAPKIKARMQQTGDAMIGFQSVNGRPNFFRLVFPSGDSTTEDDVVSMLERMDEIGSEISLDQ